MSYHTVQRQDYNGTRFLPDALSNARLTPLQLDAGMHTGKEGTEAMPYFDTFDLETIDILLISQYVFPFIFILEQLVDKPVENGLLGLACRTEIEDEDTSLRDGIYCIGLFELFLGIAIRSNYTIRADRQYNSVHHSITYVLKFDDFAHA